MFGLQRILAPYWATANPNIPKGNECFCRSSQLWARGGFHTSSWAKCSKSLASVSQPQQAGTSLSVPFPWRPPQPAGNNGLLGLHGRAQLGKRRIHSCSKARANALNVSQDHDSRSREGGACHRSMRHPHERQACRRCPSLRPATCHSFMDTEQDRVRQTAPVKCLQTNTSSRISCSRPGRPLANGNCNIGRQGHL